jgi:predicted dehydrogenase
MSPDRRVRCVIVGCGQVAHEYVQTLHRSPSVDVTACTDLDLDLAHAFARAHTISSVETFDHLLAGGDIDLAVILTPPVTHTDLALRAIAAGTSVYVEKPLAMNPGEGARILEAADRKNVLVGAAPDTFLAPPTQAAVRAISDGLIGQPIAASAALLSPGPERWHPAPKPFYAAGAGPLYDMGPYYLTALVQLLGPYTRVDGVAATARPERTIYTGPQTGQTFASAVPTHIDVTLRTTKGAAVALTTSFDIAATTRPHLEIYGTDGTLLLPDPNFHEGAVRLRRRSDRDWQALPQPPCDLEVIGRGMGVGDTARAILTGQPHRANGIQALHILQTMAAIEQAAHLAKAIDVRDHALAQDTP